MKRFKYCRPILDQGFALELGIAFNYSLDKAHLIRAKTGGEENFPLE